MALTIDSTIADLLANPKTKEVLSKHLPELISSPSISMVDQMSLPDVMPMSGGKLTQASLDAVEADLKKLK